MHKKFNSFKYEKIATSYIQIGNSESVKFFAKIKSF